MKMPTLYIITDASDTRWLEYILNEFRRIQIFEAEFKIVSLQGHEEIKSRNKIFYVKQYVTGASIVNVSGVLPNGRIVYAEKDIYVLEDTMAADKRLACPYDLFWNAFVFLSRLEEYIATQKNRSSLSHLLLHPRQDKRSLTIPIVNLLFNQLEVIIRKNFPELTFGVSAKPKVEFSHDIDYLTKSFQFMIKQSLLNGYDTLRLLPQFNDVGKSLKKSISFLFSRPSYWTFEYWEELEKRFNVRSIFYIHAKAIKKNIATWFIDPNYDLPNNPRLQAKLKHLVKDGFEVGLHGSYLSAVQEDLMAKEKKILENILQNPVTKVRQHWLRYNETVTPYIHNKFFKFDSTLGWNDRVGFRSGCASQYHPYDHKNQKAFELIETPQIIMDFNIYQSLDIENKHFLKIAFDIIDKLGECRSAYVAVSWHERACTVDFKWHKTYEMILNKVTTQWAD